MAQTVTPLPSIGEVIAGQDVAGRELRISGHPDSDRLVLSIWQSGHCLATVRLARADVPDVTRALVAGLVPLPGSSTRNSSPGDAGATVHALHPPAPGAFREITTRLGTAVTTRFPNGLRDRLSRGLSTRPRRFDPRD